MNYAQHFNPLQTPQSEKADPRQVPNSAGGFTFAVDKWRRLERFLILGAEGGSYYASERKLTIENAQVVQECCAEDGARTVSTIVEISEAGRAPKNDPAVFALALAASHPSPAARAAACSALSRVCRIGTHLFQFVDAVNQFRGWGRGLRRAVAAWYTERSPDQLAYQVAKYGQRGSWSHKNVIQLAHPEPKSPELRAVLNYIAYGVGAQPEHAKRRYDSTALGPFLTAFEELKTADERRTIALIAEHGFTHEMINSDHKQSAAVWEALLQKMPIGALVRNLGKMTQVGIVQPFSAAAQLIGQKLGNAELIKKARLHPISVLSAARVYAQGHGNKGSITWSPVSTVTDALDAAFYLAFDAIEPTGKRTLLALDVSGSMGSPIAGVTGLSCRDASACLAMVTARKEPAYHFFGFSDSFVPLDISATMRLSDVIKKISDLPFERTDCSLPMEYAIGEKLNVDMFSVYTDSETYAGRRHPHQALQAYRQERGINAKLAVVGMVSNGFTIADPSDAGMLDCVGFSTDTPSVLADFARS